MPAFEVTLQSSEPVAESTMAFHLGRVNTNHSSYEILREWKSPKRSTA